MQRFGALLDRLGGVLGPVLEPSGLRTSHAGRCGEAQGPRDGPQGPRETLLNTAGVQEVHVATCKQHDSVNAQHRSPIDRDKAAPA